MGRGDPGSGPGRGAGPTTPPLHRRQFLPVRRAAGGSGRVHPGGGGIGGRCPLRPLRPGMDPLSGKPRPISSPVGWTATWRSAPAWRASRGPGTSWESAGCSSRCRWPGGTKRPGPSPRTPWPPPAPTPTPAVSPSPSSGLGGPSPRLIRPGPCVLFREGLAYAQAAPTPAL